MKTLFQENRQEWGDFDSFKLAFDTDSGEIPLDNS